jgi:hypothetical protein
MGPLEGKDNLMIPAKENCVFYCLWTMIKVMHCGMLVFYIAATFFDAMGSVNYKEPKDLFPKVEATKMI